ncbi:uncharacterized protein LOC133520209 isoform X2 [Cydia pomonella]|uniref:uncharacterized protein LOC133520209 isoform X2 n=1 Tax=Cydia pomonella TaxID=82600 RepID=UPI002ADE1967|nr:uncharacterized protein LOC133520209 isoform X2 [Cydia pomonella]
MFLEVVTVVGHCCQFDLTHFKRFAPRNTKFVPGNTIYQGLEVTVNGVKEYANGTKRDGPVLMYIFDPNNKVTSIDSPISLAPSSYFEVEIEIFAIDSSPEVKALPLKTRKCSLSTDRAIGASFYQKCISSLLVRKVVNLCKCLPFMYSAADLSVEDYPNCTWERYLCIIPQKEVTFADMHSLIRMNDCYQSCDYVEYDPKVEFVRKLKNGKNKNYTKLAVHYASRTCMKYRRQIIYTWDQMLANLGGIFGLCLGGSFISLIEIVWFLIDILLTTINSYRQKKKTVIRVNEKDKKHGRDDNGYYKFAN